MVLTIALYFFKLYDLGVVRQLGRLVDGHGLDVARRPSDMAELSYDAKGNIRTEPPRLRNLSKAIQVASEAEEPVPKVALHNIIGFLKKVNSSNFGSKPSIVSVKSSGKRLYVKQFGRSMIRQIDPSLLNDTYGVSVIRISESPIYNSPIVVTVNPKSARPAKFRLDTELQLELVPDFKKLWTR